ncbi:MAG TPA: sulfite exporter TauE/SafE family protein [Rubrobacteraceae bacterium]|nr:sulfite exporter TauE/SafE family protein [Rubrobacteraceae bacterium]
MTRLLLVGIAGLIAQLVDGALGMSYGVTSTTLLLAAGIAPALASASVHIAEVGTTAASGLSHWRFGNVDWSKVFWLAIPGAVGAFLGAVVLSSVISAEAAEPIIAVFLFLLGIYILARFTFERAGNLINDRPIARAFLAPLGFVAGFLDAVGGGGWGPISTPTLLSSRRMEPRKVVGTVDTSEFIVALAASAGFLLTLNFNQIPFQLVGAILVGGIIAAPIAAWVVRHLNARVMGTAVGGFILLTNANTFLGAIGFDPSVNIPVYIAIVAVWVSALYLAISTTRRERKPVLETS